MAYIDYEKYLENESQHFQIRKTTTTTTTTTTATPIYEEPTCADPENEVYQACGNKCVLGCRFANTTEDIVTSKKVCDKNVCVAGCFCKAGLVRHHSRCIPATECPIQKCQRDESYVSFKFCHFILQSKKSNIQHISFRHSNADQQCQLHVKISSDAMKLLKE